MLGNIGLDEDGGLFGIEAGGEEVHGHILNTRADAGGIGVFGGEGVEVCDEEEAGVIVLQADPVVQRAHVVAEVQHARGPHAAEDAFLRIV